MAQPFPPAWVLDLQPVFGEQPGVWLVGGAVRDHLLRRDCHDLDFAVQGESRSLARRVADRLGGAYFDLDPARDAGRVLHRTADGVRWRLDFSRLRRDSIEQDLTERDFTLNAIALDLHQAGHWLDPTGGAKDLKDRRVRTCTPASIPSDPVRALRAVRLAALLSFQMDSATIDQVRCAHGQIGRVSPERVRDEAVRMMELTRPSTAIRLLDQLGLMPDVFPEVDGLRGLQQPPQHDYEALEHTLAVLDHVCELLAVLAPRPDEELTADLTLGWVALRLGRFRQALDKHLGRVLAGERAIRHLLLLAALYHDVGKARTQSVDDDGKVRFLGHEAIGAEMAAAWAQRMRFSRLEADRLRTVVANHMRPGQLEKSLPISRRAIYRYYRQLGDAGVEVVLLSLGDFLGKHAPPPPQDAWAGRLNTARELLEGLYERTAEVVDPPRLIDGVQLMTALGLLPGRKVGILLEAIREAQAEGKVSTRQEALDLARRTSADGPAG